MNPADIPIRDLHLPPEVSWWPLAPGWWFVIAVLALALALTLRLAWRRYRRNQARRVALRQVELARAEFAEDGDAVRLASRLSELLRRTMLAYAPRGEVAGLAGEEWMAWLDSDLDQPLFSRGDGRELLTLPYRNPDSGVGDVNIDGLIGAVRQRIRTPHRGAA